MRSLKQSDFSKMFQTFSVEILPILSKVLPHEILEKIMAPLLKGIKNSLFNTIYLQKKIFFSCLSAKLISQNGFKMLMDSNNFV